MAGRQKHLFRFKQFDIYQEISAMKVGTDGVLLGAWADFENGVSILDIGTGTGVIAIMAAQRNKTAKITALEIDSESALQAKENALRCPWSDRLEVLHKSLQNYALENHNTKFDIIVSNPPFFTGKMVSPYFRKAGGRHDVSLRHDELLRYATSLMHKDSIFSLILPVVEGERFITLSKEYDLEPTRITAVLPKNDKPVERWLIELRSAPVTIIERNNLVIQHEERNDWTSQYRAMLKEFYLNL